MRNTLFFLLSCGLAAAADSPREAGLSAVNRCLQAVAGGRVEAALVEFDAPERASAVTRRQLETLGAEGATAALPAVTGHSRARHEGREVLHLFGQAQTASGPRQMHADLVQDGARWQLTRLQVGAAEAGTGRMSPMAIPAVTDAVNSMVSSEMVINGFFAAMGRGDYAAAAACWLPGKVTAAQLEAFAAARPEMIRGFHRVEEGRTNFSFARDAADRVNEIGANGKLAYDEGRTMKPFRGRVVRAEGALRIAELDLRLSERYW